MTADAGPPRAKITLGTATAITVANMIGTGVFTSLGFQVEKISSGFLILLLWGGGGLFALCGALSYGELASSLPRSGGEFNFLGRIYHPLAGFLAGWVSLMVGFAPPIALAAMAFGRYFAQALPGISPLLVSVALVVAVTLVHLRDLRTGAWFQNLFTALKVLLILVLVVASWRYSQPAAIDFWPRQGDWQGLLGAPFAISLLFVMYSYTGWNAATYIIDEVRDPVRTVPRSLFLGTALVTVMYVALNGSFLRVAPMEELAGKVEIAHVVAIRLFGDLGGRWMSGLLCLALVSTVSAMTWAGPRVTQVMGQDHAWLRGLSITVRGVPRRAILFQSGLVILLLSTSTFEAVLVYTQFSLGLSSLLAVLGVFYLRRTGRSAASGRWSWGYPFAPGLFAVVSCFALGHALVTQPVESVAGLLTILVGVPIYFLSARASGRGEERANG